MTGNSVTLYKVYWNYGSTIQPYFVSDTARDIHLAMFNPFEIKFNGNVNIVLGYNLDIKLIIPVDITVALEYNYCKIIYNNKTYFAYILDHQMKNVGFSEIQCHRQVIAERTNFLSYFRDFQIEQSTYVNINEDISGYSKTKTWYLPNFRYSKKESNVTQNFYYKILANGEYEYNNVPLTYVNGYIAFCSAESGAEGIKNFYGSETQYNMYFIPISQRGIQKYYFKHFEYDKFKRVTNYSMNSLTLSGDRDISNILDSLSPRLISLKHIRFPVGLYSDGYLLPYYWSSNQSGYFSLFATAFEDIIDDYMLFNYTPESPFGNVTFTFYSKDCSIVINKSDYITNDSDTISCKYQYIFDSVSDELLVIIYGSNENSVNGASIKLNIVSMDLGDSTSFVIDSSENFDAQNRYYDAMTQSVRNQKLLNTFIEGAENTTLGGVQISFGGAMKGAGQLASNALGFGNVVRAASSVGSGINDVIRYSEQRELYAKNERAKPDTAMSGSSGNARYIESTLVAEVIEEIPFDSDLDAWKNNSVTYGIIQNKFYATLSYSNLVYKGYFFLKCNCTIIYSSIALTYQEYSEIYSLLQNGCRYIVID